MARVQPDHGAIISIFKNYFGDILKITNSRSLLSLYRDDICKSSRIYGLEFCMCGFQTKQMIKTTEYLSIYEQLLRKNTHKS